MYDKRIRFLAVFVSSCFALVLVAFAWGSDASARPDVHTSGTLAVQSARPQFAGYADAPAYDSGWKDLGIRPDPIPVVFTHALGGNPDDYFVSLECRDDSSLSTYECTNQGFNVDAVWYGLDDTYISVFAENMLPDAVRVRIYTETPAYDSGWEDLGTRPDPIAVVFTHTLGGNPDNYLVSLECRDDSSLGTYNCTNQGFNADALWYGLDATNISVYAKSMLPDAVRVRIYIETPTYDSGWETFGMRPDPIAAVFTHTLGGNPDDYLVSLECRSNSSLGTYGCTNQGFNIDALWYGLDATYVSAFAENVLPDAIRIRIWRTYTIYLPIVTRNLDVP